METATAAKAKVRVLNSLLSGRTNYGFLLFIDWHVLRSKFNTLLLLLKLLGLGPIAIGSRNGGLISYTFSKGHPFPVS